MGLGDGSTSFGTGNGTNGSVIGDHLYTAAGVYPVRLTVNDSAGASAQALFQYAVVYNPNPGIVVGGGWIESPAGAYLRDSSISGQAHFGFVAKHREGVLDSADQAQLRFQLEGLEFQSTRFESLKIAGASAQYTSEGTINHDGRYSFLLTAIDGQAEGGDRIDRFRIKIWDQRSGEIIYDNQIGDDRAEAAAPLGEGSIMIDQ